MDQDELKPKRGEAKDLKEQFTEVLTELVHQVMQLERIHISSHPIEGPSEVLDIGLYDPEIGKAVDRLTDAVSNTMIMDPH